MKESQKDEISEVLSTNRLKGTNVKVISPHLESLIARKGGKIMDRYNKGPLMAKNSKEEN